MVFTLQVNSQTTFFNVFSNTGYDRGEGVTQLLDSSYLIVGTSTSFLDAPSQFFALKLDKNGNFLWSRDYGGSEVDNGKRVWVVNDTIYLFGTSSSNTIADYNWQMITTDSLGNQLNTFQYDESGWEFLEDVLLLKDSSFLLMGSTNNSADGKKDALAKCVDRQGNVLWTIKNEYNNDNWFASGTLLTDSSFVLVENRWNTDSLLQKMVVSNFTLQGVLNGEITYGDQGNYTAKKIYLGQNGLYMGGYRISPQDTLKDYYYARTDLQGAVLQLDEHYEIGEKEVVDIIQYAPNRYYIAVNADDQFSFAGGTDVAYFKFSENLYYDYKAVEVKALNPDFHGQIIATMDNGFIAMGSSSTLGSGDLSVYVLKAGVNDSFPNTTAPPNQQDLVSIDELASAKTLGFQFYPNPTEKWIHIDSKQLVQGAIELISMEGRLLYSEEINGLSVDLNLEDLPVGMYFIRLVSKQGMVGLGRIVIR